MFYLVDSDNSSACFSESLGQSCAMKELPPNLKRVIKAQFREFIFQIDQSQPHIEKSSLSQKPLSNYTEW